MTKFRLSPGDRLIRETAGEPARPAMSVVRRLEMTAEEISQVLALPESSALRRMVVQVLAQSSPSLGNLSSSAVPASSYVFALRSQQPGFGMWVDQSPAGTLFQDSPGLWALSWVPNSVVAAGAYRTPPVMNGLIYSAGGAGTTGATSPVWPTTIGGTVVDNGITWTAQEGPWFADSGGFRLFRTLASASIGTFGGLKATPAAPTWDNLLDSFILNLRIKQDWAATGQAAASPIFSTRDPAAAFWSGFRVLATGAPFQNFRLGFRAGADSVLTDDLSTSFSRKVFDGTERNLTIQYDAPSRMLYSHVDGIPITQGDMNSGSGLCPNGLSLAALTSSTKGHPPFTIGGDYSNTSFKCAFRDIDFLLLKDQSLPLNIQGVSAFFSRGGSLLLPNSATI